MSSESAATAPTPFHIWVAPYERGGRKIRGHWRPRSGQADEARNWLEVRGISPDDEWIPFEPGPMEPGPMEPGPMEPGPMEPGEYTPSTTRKTTERDQPRPLPQRGSQQPPRIGSSLASDEPPIGEILARLGVDRSEGRRWRGKGKHPSLRWHRRYEGELAEV